jgi:hypothetical protein
MTDQEKLAEIKKRISDLGTMVLDQQLVTVLWNRLWAIREIVLTETPTKPYVPE